MSAVTLVWATPDGDKLIGYMARVSNTKATKNDTFQKLLRYLVKHRHWSPFEMANACVYIECPRDISRQILRHRSFTFQEFSGRYASYNDLLLGREARLQDTENRQNSIPVGDVELEKRWDALVQVVRTVCIWAYRSALAMGVAKEVARVLLPEGLVPTRMYMNGTMRSWIHYWSVRCGPDTQKEHREIAEETKRVVLQAYPELAEIIRAEAETS